MMAQSITELYGEEYFDYLQQRSPVRRLVRKLYLHDIKSLCSGPTIDFGCGVGELLRILPPDSVGFEVNPLAVEYCRKIGLDVSVYDPGNDQYQFTNIPENIFTTFTMNHVLEHIPDSSTAIKSIFESCARLGIKRIVFTVPGIKGYRADKTHRTFIDKKYLADSGILENKNYRMVINRYFPVNVAGFGRFCRHNELRLVFDRKS